MDLKNEYEYMLIEFVYDTTYYAPLINDHLRRQDNCDYRISTYLKEICKKKILTKNEIQGLSSDYNTVKPLIEKVYDNYDFQDRYISNKIPKEEIYHVLDKVELEARPIIDELIYTFCSLKASLPLSVFTYDRVFDDFDLLVKSYDVIKNKSITSEEEFCNELGIIYYNDDIHWPILKQWLIDHGCESKHIGIFRLRINALYAWERIKEYPNVTLEELKNELDLY